MKKIIIIFGLCILLCLTFVGCSGKKIEGRTECIRVEQGE